MPDVPSFFAGESLSASKLNALVELVAARLVVRAGEGMTASDVGGQVVLGLVTGRMDGLGEVRFGRIVDVQGADGDLVEVVKYKTCVIGQEEQTTSDWRVPLYGRSVLSGQRLERVAKVNELCLIVRAMGPNGEPASEMWVLTEKEKVEVCTPGPSPVMGGGMVRVVRADGTIGFVPVVPPDGGGPLGAGGAPGGNDAGAAGAQ